MEGAKLIGIKYADKNNVKHADIWARKPCDVIGRYAPRSGVDYGVAGKVIIKDMRNGNMLIWRGGFTSWMSVGQSGHYPSCLDFYGKEEMRHGLGTTIHEGGRLSKALMERLEEKIDAVFGYPVAHLYLHGHTVFIEEMKK